MSPEGRKIVSKKKGGEGIVLDQKCRASALFDKLPSEGDSQGKTSLIPDLLHVEVQVVLHPPGLLTLRQYDVVINDIVCLRLLIGYS
jgi:hypothetical protein